MSDDTERIGPTAHYTAHVWHRLGLPYAEHFSTPTGVVLYWGFFAIGEWVTRLPLAVPSMREYLEYRHRLIDAVVCVLDPGCVVELGAGLTPRAVAWAAQQGVPAIELDLPAMAAVKRLHLSRAPVGLQQRLAARHSVHDVDVLGPELCGQLAGWLRGKARPVVIAEGLLNYFDQADRRRVLAGVAGALREVGGGWMVSDLHTAAAQAQVGWAMHALRAAIRGLTRRRRALDPFADMPTLRQAFRDAGFDDCREERPEAYVHAEPRLARLHSPAHVITARVDPVPE